MAEQPKRPTQEPDRAAGIPTQPPCITLEPIPNLDVDSVNAEFQMEVRQTGPEETGGATNGWFGLNISGSGSVTSNDEARDTDHASKYHVDTTVQEHPEPEGLSRLLEILSDSLDPAAPHGAEDTAKTADRGADEP